MDWFRRRAFVEVVRADAPGLGRDVAFLHIWLMRLVEVRDCAQHVQDAAVERPFLVMRLVEELAEGVHMLGGYRVHLVALLSGEIDLGEEPEEHEKRLLVDLVCLERRDRSEDGFHDVGVGDHTVQVVLGIMAVKKGVDGVAVVACQHAEVQRVIVGRDPRAVEEARVSPERVCGGHRFPFQDFRDGPVLQVVHCLRGDVSHPHFVFNLLDVHARPLCQDRGERPRGPAIALRRLPPR